MMKIAFNTKKIDPVIDEDYHYTRRRVRRTTKIKKNRLNRLRCGAIVDACLRLNE